MKRKGSHRAFLAATAVAAVLAGAAENGLLGVCGPFTDISDPAFCPFVTEIFTLGITTGTTPTTYAPSDDVTRLQMAVFLSRTVDQSLQRAGRRAALGRYWAPKNAANLGLTAVGLNPNNVRWDGKDLWVADRTSGSVYRVRASDARLLETWTGATIANDAVVAMGKVFVNAYSTPSHLYRIDPSQPAGVVTTVATIGGSSDGITFDGSRIWTANQNGSVSIVTPGPSLPWTVTSATAGFTAPTGILFDGANIWITDFTAGALFKLDFSGAVLQTVSLGNGPAFPVFDGANIWVPLNTGAKVAVVRASNGAVLGTLTGNGQSFPNTAAFDGERVLVTNYTGNAVSLWKAADLTPLGFVPTGGGTVPVGACSDGVNFWITLLISGQLARF